ncbi:FKBP-type peptidyl-prolyl cis-trans isomerase [Marivirga harenae]|uniref:FKBP-type peptidyl-prolyl cis-trans isomerase n=1 Tax=Marivirga harenae TaxID=2010992 RepID=UPI0026DF93CD|nr:FKBP-type peptidyl-prolyl cis-trans isomerase [Marivirga harenae]WKV13447.1 FKBP-type peptidyl-prolyl cis-trans isomerase [Marivirga harenae]|tara:strand:+ start:64903 stop:65430 length:528 start_codon:yes stop_codon:yes gene_type:complete
MNKLSFVMIKNLLSISIFTVLFVGIFSCQSEVQCNQIPENSADQTRLEQQIQEIESFLESEGIEYQTHSSGIRYSVLESGEGNSPDFCSGVSVDYEGRVLGEDETFISGIGTDFSLRSNQVVVGFKIAISLMNRNADYRLFIPGELLINRGISNTVPSSIPDGENIEFRVRLNSY